MKRVLSIFLEFGIIARMKNKGDVSVFSGFSRIRKKQKRPFYLKTTGNHPYPVLDKEEFSEEKEFAEPKAMWKAGNNQERKFLLAEEGKEGENLPCPEYKHPPNNSCFGLSNFSLQLGNPFFKALFGDFQNSFLSPVFNFVQNINQGISPAVTQLFSQDIRYSNNSHFNLLSYLNLTIRSLACQAEIAPPEAYVSVSPVSGGWMKVIYLRPGDEIAVVPRNILRASAARQQSIRESRSTRSGSAANGYSAIMWKKYV